MFIIECQQKIVGNADHLIQWHRAEQSWGCLDQWEIQKRKVKKNFLFKKVFRPMLRGNRPKTWQALSFKKSWLHQRSQEKQTAEPDSIIEHSDDPERSSECSDSSIKIFLKVWQDRQKPLDFQNFMI
jgi:hypothetical protein